MFCGNHNGNGNANEIPLTKEGNPNGNGNEKSAHKIHLYQEFTEKKGNAQKMNFWE